MKLKLGVCILVPQSINLTIIRVRNCFGVDTISTFQLLKHGNAKTIVYIQNTPLLLVRVRNCFGLGIVLTCVVVKLMGCCN